MEATALLQRYPDAEPLTASGYFCHAVMLNNLTQFRVMTANHYIDPVMRIEVIYPQRIEWLHVDNPRAFQPARITTMAQATLTEAEAAALAETLGLAVVLANALNEEWHVWNAKAEQEREAYRAKREREMEEYRARQQAEREATAKRIAEKIEKLKWYIGDDFKLKRRGYRATVFGTIEDFGPRHMFTTSERGKRMRIEVDSIYRLWLKGEGRGAWELIIDEPEDRNA